ncbi:hypothetical protein KKF64_01950 [Patescibacteria group bacterium]|nr:hypothetical protein [Patescibacteria group bacterium]
MTTAQTQKRIPVVVVKGKRDQIEKDLPVLFWVDEILDSLREKFPSVTFLLKYTPDVARIGSLPIGVCHLYFPNLEMEITDPIATFYLRHSLGEEVEFVTQVGDLNLTLDELKGHIIEIIAAKLDIEEVEKLDPAFAQQLQKVRNSFVPIYDENNLKRWLEYHKKHG